MIAAAATATATATATAAVAVAKVRTDPKETTNCQRGAQYQTVALSSTIATTL